MGLSQPHVNNLPVNTQRGAGQLPTYKTSVSVNSQGQKEVVFHQTAVVTFDQEIITLNTGGWWTRTTKVRMNQSSEAFGLGFRVFQKAGRWFVDYKASVRPFTDNQLAFNR